MNIAPDGLCVEKVHVWRGDRHVLKGVSLAVCPGELMHVSGPNGTGKTTLLRVVSGLLRPENGSVAWQGRSIAASAAEYQSVLAYASHEPALKSDLTALENLRFTVGLKRRVTSAELRSSLERTGVAGCADLPARVLSAGQRRRVAMARVLAFRAALWLLDEPFTNLDASGSSLLSALLAEHVKDGGAALVVAHHDLNVAALTRQLELQ
jgi:heme exporter protein A